jgi:diphthine synthase
MVLYLIGLGIGDEKDITLKGLELVKKSDIVYLENYTSKLNCSTNDLEKLYGKKVNIVDREFVEQKDTLFEQAKNKNVALLIIGDVFGATTHTAIIQRAKELKINFTIVHNTSILNAVGETGLSLYNFGKTTSIPFDNSSVVSPINALKQNQKSGLHTLFLLDLKPSENRFMSINEAIGYLIKNKIKDNTLAVACCALGSSKQAIFYGNLKELKEKKYNSYPQCLIIPGNMHFMEKEYIENFRLV